MDTTDFTSLVTRWLDVLASAPSLAPWFQAIGSLVTLLAVSLIPWLRGRSRQRAFLLRARLFLLEAHILTKDKKNEVDYFGTLKIDEKQLKTVEDQLKAFPVEELSQKAAGAFQVCRVAFLNTGLSMRDCSDDDMMAPPIRLGIMRSFLEFLHLCKKHRRTLLLERKDDHKYKRMQSDILAQSLLRKDHYEQQWQLEARKRIDDAVNTGPSSPSADVAK